MKIKCKVCRKETEIDELQYNPGDKIVVECKRCGNELEAVIPLREEAPEEKPHVKVVDNDLKSVWYASAYKEKKESSSPETQKDRETEKIRQTAQTDRPTTTSSFQTGLPKPPTGQTSKPHTSEKVNPVTNIRPATKSDENKSSSMKVLVGILIVVVIILGGWILLGKGESGNENQDYAVVEEAVEPEVVEVAVDPFYDIIDHPERELKLSDIQNFDKAQLRILRNAYFARHGYIFNDPELTHFFSQFSWYHPYTKDVINNFSQVEKNNVELIRGYEGR